MNANLCRSLLRLNNAGAHLVFIVFPCNKLRVEPVFITSECEQSRGKSMWIFESILGKFMLC